MNNTKNLINTAHEEMRRYFAGDAKRISHAETVLKYADKILSSEKGDPAVVGLAAVFHDIGIHECERKFNSTAGHLQEQEGPPIARKILSGMKVGDNIIDEVCAIIASHHSAGEIDTANFKIIWDADWLVNLPDCIDIKDASKVRASINKIFMTKTGKKLAEQIFLP